MRGPCYQLQRPKMAAALSSHAREHVRLMNTTIDLARYISLGSVSTIVNAIYIEMRKSHRKIGPHS